MLDAALEASAGNRQGFAGPAVARNHRPHRGLLRAISAGAMDADLRIRMAESKPGA